MKHAYNVHKYRNPVSAITVHRMVDILILESLFLKRQVWPAKAKIENIDNTGQIDNTGFAPHSEGWKPIPFPLTKKEGNCGPKA